MSYDKYEHILIVAKLEIEYWQEVAKQNKFDTALIDLSLDSQKRLFNTITRIENLKVRV